MASDQDHLEHFLRWRLRCFSNQNAAVQAALRQVLDLLRRAGLKAYLFGGVLRDLMLSNGQVTPRDVDLVVGNAQPGVLEAVFSPHIVRRNRFGGLNLRVRGQSFDVWRLEDTWAFRESLIPGGSFGDLPRTTPFTVEAVVAELTPLAGRPRIIYHYGFFESMTNRVVELNLPVSPFPALTILRAFLISERLGFAIGPKLIAYIADQSNRLPAEAICRVQRSHYGYTAYDAADIADRIARVNDQHRHRPGVPLRLPRPVQLLLFPEPPAFLACPAQTPCFKPCPVETWTSSENDGPSHENDSRHAQQTEAWQAWAADDGTPRPCQQLHGSPQV